jgi:hypothetical protein
MNGHPPEYYEPSDGDSNPWRSVAVFFAIAMVVMAGLYVFYPFSDLKAQLGIGSDINANEIKTISAGERFKVEFTSGEEPMLLSGFNTSIVKLIDSNAVVNTTTNTTIYPTWWTFQGVKVGSTYITFQLAGNTHYIIKVIVGGE